MEWKDARKIIKSQDISFTFTSIIAYRYHAIRSFPHFCFFEQVEESRSRLSVLAFFVYFSFTGWARLLFADGVRQAIYFIQLYEIFGANSPSQADNHDFFSAVAYTFDRIFQGYNYNLTNVFGFMFMFLSFVIWTLSLLQLFIGTKLISLETNFN